MDTASFLIFMRFFARCRRFLPSVSALFLVAAVSGFSAQDVPAAALSHSTVFFQEDLFAGWPANGGSWQWGDEVLVSFDIADYQLRADTHSHKADSRPRAQFARSLDGGKTWASEHPTGLQGRASILVEGVQDMQAPGFAMRLRGEHFFISLDKGHTWQGPYLLPAFAEVQGQTNARTSYIVTGPQRALFFMTTRSGGTDGERGRAYAMRTQDGCKTFEFLGWMSPELVPQAKPQELAKPIFSIMPSVVRVGADHYVAAMRQRIDRRKWTDVFESKDGGRTWTFLSKAESGSNNPPALVRLADGKTLALLYGYRGRDLGVRARVSADNGQSWSDEYILRKDALSWDIGYPRAHVLPSGEVLVIYYYTTPAHEQQHIAATRWQPPIQAAVSH